MVMLDPADRGLLLGADLDVLPLGLVVQHVRHVFREDLLSSRTGVDTHHGHTDGPGGIANCHLQVRIIGLWTHPSNIKYRQIYVITTTTKMGTTPIHTLGVQFIMYSYDYCTSIKGRQAEIVGNTDTGDKNPP